MPPTVASGRARTSSLSFSSLFLAELGLTQNSAQTALLLLDNSSILSTTTYMISQSRVSCYNSTNLGDLWVQPGAVGHRGSWRIESDYTKREQMSVLPSHSKDSRVTEKVLSFAGDGSQLWRGVSLPNNSMNTLYSLLLPICGRWGCCRLNEDLETPMAGTTLGSIDR
jgi:hypothetical protein